MTLSSKVPTAPTPPLSSAGNPGERVTQSSPSASLGKMRTSTEIMKTQSLATLPGAPKNWKDWDRISLAAFLLQGAVARLQKAGLLKLHRLLSEDGSSVREIQLTFDPSIWTETLILKVLSTAESTVVKGEK